MSENIEQDIYYIAGQVKLVCGMGNNAAWVLCLDALDQLRKHPSYRQNVKRAFKEAMEEFARYERGLIYALNNRMFHVNDMTDDIRAKYTDISDRDYYDFWASNGGVIYQKTKPMVTSLVNKYRLSLLSHGVKNAEIVAWGLTALAGLDIAVKIWRSAIRTNAREYDFPEKRLYPLFKGLSLEPVAKKWRAAMQRLESTTYKLESLELKNITQGLVQLAQAWSDPETVFGSAYANTKEWGEVFSDKKAKQNAMREILAVKKELTNKRPRA
jgi:hypothetical protein